MVRRLSVVCEDDLARRIERLANEHEITEEEAVRQLLGLGLERIE